MRRGWAGFVPRSMMVLPRRAQGSAGVRSGLDRGWGMALLANVRRGLWRRPVFSFSSVEEAVGDCNSFSSVEEAAGDCNLFSSVKVGAQRRNLGAQFKSYLPLAPEFYKILVDSKNNWVLIKVLKIFVKLAPLEPRLAKRVVEPICEHIRKTEAKSLLFECIKTMVSSLSEYENAMRLAVVKIREMLVDDDPNLKYLGLQALAVVAPKHLWAVLENNCIKCLKRDKKSE
ncbi:hypothetical protein ACLB2K_007654 [Fragaria x ananassa]